MVFTRYKPENFLKEFPDEYECDAIVIGAGPNGLITALYLQSANLKVVLCERRYEIAGGLATEEILFPSNLSNTHAIYMMMIDYMPVLRDFNLEKHGLDFLKPANQVSFVSRDGFIISLSRMLQDSKDSVCQISFDEADRFEKIFRNWRRIVDEILAPATYIPPLPPIEMVESFQRTNLGKEFLELSEKSPIEVIDKAFSSDKLKALLTYLVGMWGVDPEETGMGFMVPLLVVRATQKCYTYGGSHRFASAMAREFCSLGGIILDNAEVEKIIVEGKKAVGVKLKDGRKIFAKVVASSLPAPITFEKLSQIPESAKEEAQILKDWKWDKWSFFTLHFTSKSTPKLKPGRENPLSFMTIIGFSNLEDVMDFFRKLKEGKPEIRGGHFTCQSMFDDTLSRDGKVVSFLQVCFPYCDYKKEEIERELLKLCEEYFEFSQDEIASEGPKEIEMRLTSMVRGSIKHGDYTPTQMGYFRPTENSSSSATPVEGLYLCGASTYPGGLIIGGQGYIAANRICDDLGVKKWWKPPDFILRFLKNYGDK
jgi:phytoene dehydrogenase-like protein